MSIVINISTRRNDIIMNVTWNWPGITWHLPSELCSCPERWPLIFKGRKDVSVPKFSFFPPYFEKIDYQSQTLLRSKITNKDKPQPPTKAVKKIEHKAAPAQIEMECAGPRSPSLTFRGAVELPRTLCFPNLIMLYYCYTTFVVQARKQRWLIQLKSIL